jgi:hypothetical protein
MFQSHYDPPPHRGHAGGRSPTRPRYHGPARGRGGPSPTDPPPPIMVPSKGRGCLVMVDDKVRDDEGHILPLVSSSPFFFLKNAEDSSHPFSHKCDRFVG